MLRDLNTRHSGVRRVDPCAIVRMLRDLNQTEAPGMRRLGLSTTGMLGADLPRTGEHGPSWMYPSIDLPTDADKEYSLWIRSTTLPAGILPPNEYGSLVAPGLPDGAYPTAFTLREWGVPLEPDVTATIYVGSVFIGGGSVQKDRGRHPLRPPSRMASRVPLALRKQKQPAIPAPVPTVVAKPKPVNLPAFGIGASLASNAPAQGLFVQQPVPYVSAGISDVLANMKRQAAEMQAMDAAARKADDDDINDILGLL